MPSTTRDQLTLTIKPEDCYPCHFPIRMLPRWAQYQRCHRTQRWLPTTYAFVYLCMQSHEPMRLKLRAEDRDRGDKLISQAFVDADGEIYARQEFLSLEGKRRLHRPSFYRLPQALTELERWRFLGEPGDPPTLLVVEGEGVADVAAAKYEVFNYLPISAGNASSICPDAAYLLAQVAREWGCDVHFLPDNDEPGRRGMANAKRWFDAALASLTSEAQEQRDRERKLTRP